MAGDGLSIGPFSSDHTLLTESQSIAKTGVAAQGRDLGTDYHDLWLNVLTGLVFHLIILEIMIISGLGRREKLWKKRIDLEIDGRPVSCFFRGIWAM